MKKEYILNRIEISEEPYEILDIYFALSNSIDCGFGQKIEMLKNISGRLIEKEFTSILYSLFTQYVRHARVNEICGYYQEFRAISQTELLKDYLVFDEWLKRPTDENIGVVESIINSNEFKNNTEYYDDLEAYYANRVGLIKDSISLFPVDFLNEHLEKLLKHGDMDFILNLIKNYLVVYNRSQERQVAMDFVEEVVNEKNKFLTNDMVVEIYEMLAEYVSSKSESNNDTRRKAEFLEKAFELRNLQEEDSDHQDRIIELMKTYYGLDDAVNELYWTKIYCSHYLETTSENFLMEILDHYILCIEVLFHRKLDVRMFDLEEYAQHFMSCVSYLHSKQAITMWAERIIEVAKDLSMDGFTQDWIEGLRESKACDKNLYFKLKRLLSLSQVPEISFKN